MRNVRSGLVKAIRGKIESDPVAMRRVGIFLCEVGSSLDNANMFALQLANQVAGCGKNSKVELNGDSNSN